MRPFVLATLAAALLSLYSIVRLPSALAICFFIAFAAFALLGFRQTSKVLEPKVLNLTSYAAFLGFLALSAIMGGYYADVKGVGGTILPELWVWGIGTFLLIFEAWRHSTRQ